MGFGTAETHRLGHVMSVAVPDTPADNGEYTRIRGARVHNLQNVDLDLPRNRMVVITGPSGSGKSSLAFDTLYAEGQRQYIESLSVYARQFLHQLERPDVDLIEGLQPTISIDQRPAIANPRSTVATATELYDYLRLLMARLGEPFCYRCGAPIAQQTTEEIVGDLMALPEGTRLMLLAPLVRGRKGAHEEVFAEIRKAGLVRARVDGQIVDVNEPPKLVRQKKHQIEAVVDRVVIRPMAGVRDRLVESIRLAIKHGGGLVLATFEERTPSPEPVWRDRLFSTEYACPNCRISYEELEPRTFSFNSPYGACPACEGLGVRAEAEAFRGEVPCPACGGARLRPEARAVRIAGKAIHEITAMTVRRARAFFVELRFADDDAPVARPILADIASRLEFLDRVGLDYLTLDRPADTLSGGELQRVRLATGLGSGLVGVCYVLDEPSIGLHPRDNQRLIDALRELQARGNTVVVVEHDEAIMRRADWLVDLGPGAGRHGGRVVAQGTPCQLAQSPHSLTGRYLRGDLCIPLPERRRPVFKTRALVLEGVATNNLKNLSVQFPLSALVCVTGVSGSGKSSLLNETLARALARRLGGAGPPAGPHASLRGAHRVDKVVQVDQSPIGRTPRSNPATYTGAFDEIRKVFAQTRAARQRGYKASRFSFNVPGGRCEECQGQGQRKIEMNFLPDLHVACPACGGKRFNRQTLEVRYRDHSIADVLDLRVDDAAALFENFPGLCRLLGCLQQVGLGYITLGQPSTTLSGGEAQRVKLAAELGRADTGRTVYILDEPTTGLHFHDIQQLLAVLNRLVDLGNTVLVIEHHLDVIKTADWIIDLGPEGGERGGYLVATGTPEQVAAVEHSHTGRSLRAVLAGGGVPG